MKKKIVLALLSLTAAVVTSVVLIGSKDSSMSIAGECEHSGNHYAAKEQTCTTSGYLEHWVCCTCHEVFLEEPGSGVWTDQTELQYVMQDTNPAYVAPHTFNKQVVDSKYLAAAATFSSPATYYHSCECGEKGTTTFTYGDTVYKDFGKAGFSGYRLYMSRDDVAFKFRLTIPTANFVNEAGIMLTFDELNASGTRDGSNTIEIKWNNAGWYGVFSYKTGAFLQAWWGTSLSVVASAKDGTTTIDAFIRYDYLNGEGSFVSGMPTVTKNTKLGVTFWEYGTPPQGEINSYAFKSGWYCDPLNPTAYLYVGADGISSVIFGGGFTANEDANLPL